MKKFVILLLAFIAPGIYAYAQNGNPVPLPAQSRSFPVGKKVEFYDLTDIHGNDIKAADLKGKIVVLNFWFMGCVPCRKEMPALNELAYEYARQPDVVFIAIALDKKPALKEFIKTHPLAYQVVADGQLYNRRYGVDIYPTNVIIDRKGIVCFSDDGFSNTTQYWLRKKIEDAKIIN